MKFKIYIVLCMFLFLLAFASVSADGVDTINNGAVIAYNIPSDEDNTWVYDNFNFSDGLQIEGGANETSGLIYDPNGVIGGAYFVDGTYDPGNNDWISLNWFNSSDTNASGVNVEDYSVSMWLKSNSTNPNNYGAEIFGSWGSASDKLELRYEPNGYLDFTDERDNTQRLITDESGTIWDGDWHHVFFSAKRNGYSYLYIDGVEIGNASIADTTIVINKDFAWGGLRNDLSNWDGINLPYYGSLDLFAFWNRQLTRAEVAALYNSGSGLALPYSGGSPPVGNTSYFDVTSDFLGLSVSSFNITLGNGSVYSTDNGTINTGINQSDGSIFNFTARGENEHFVPVSFLNFNTSVDVQVNFSRYPLVDLYSVWNGSKLSGFNASINGSVYDSDSVLAYVREVGVSGEVFVDKLGFIGQNFSFDSALNAVTNVSLYQSVLYVRAFSKVSGSLLDNYTLLTGVGNFNNDSGLLTLYPDLDNYSFNFSFGGGYFNLSGEALEVDSVVNYFNLSGVYDKVVSLKFLNFSSNSPVYNLSGLVNVSGFSEVFSGESNVSLNLESGLLYDFEVNGSVDYVSDHQSNFLRGVNITSNSALNVSLFRDESLVISFVDILTNGYVDALDFLMLGSTTYSFDTINTSDVGFGYFVDLDVGSYDLLANKSGYTDFSVSTSISSGSLTNISGSVTGSSQEVSLFVRNVYDQYLSNVSVTIARQSDDSIVSSGFTDSSGGIKFDLSDRIAYNVYFFKFGFDNLSGTLRVADTTYTFTMVQTNSSDVSRYAGINIVFSPSGSLLDNGSVYNFSGSFTSSVFNVSNFAFYLYDGLYLVDDSVSLVGTGAGAFTTIDGSYSVNGFNTSLVDTFLTARVVLELDDLSNISYYKIYSINSIYEGDASLSKAFSRFGSFDKAGFEDPDRFFWSVLVIIAITFSVAGIGGFVNDEEKILLLITLLVGIASWAGFMDLSFAPVDEGWILFTLLGVLTLFLYFKKWRDR